MWVWHPVVVFWVVITTKIKCIKNWRCIVLCQDQYHLTSVLFDQICTSHDLSVLSHACSPLWNDVSIRVFVAGILRPVMRHCCCMAPCWTQGHVWCSSISAMARTNSLTSWWDKCTNSAYVQKITWRWLLILNCLFLQLKQELKLLTGKCSLRNIPFKWYERDPDLTCASHPVQSGWSCNPEVELCFGFTTCV